MMIASNLNLCFIIFYIIFGFSERFADCCVSEYSTNQSRDEYSFVLKMFEIFNEDDEGGSSEVPDDENSQSRKDIIKKALEPDLRRAYSKGSKSMLTRASAWLVQTLAAHYSLSFIKGYFEHQSDNVEMALNCAFVGAYLAAFVSDEETGGIFSQQFLERIPSVATSEVTTKAQNAATAYSELASRLGYLYEYMYNAETGKFEQRFFEDSHIEQGEVICKYFGKILYGADQPRSDKFIERNTWRLAKHLKEDVIENSDEHEKMTEVLRKLDLRGGNKSERLDFSVSLMFIGRLLLNYRDIYELRIARIKDNKNYWPNTKEVDGPFIPIL